MYVVTLCVVCGYNLANSCNEGSNLSRSATQSATQRDFASFPSALQTGLLAP